MVAVRHPSWLPLERSIGVKADGSDVGVTFLTVFDAETNAKILLSRGCRHVEIFDRKTGKPVIEPRGKSPLH
jgi:hypothetical protein